MRYFLLMLAMVALNLPAFAAGTFIGKVYAIKTDSKGLAKSPWPMRGQNPQHTGRADK